MANKKDYDLEKVMQAYQKYIDGTYFEKARAVILKDDKIVYIKDSKSNKLNIPGGGVDDKESIEDAAVREALEETGYKVKPIMPVQKKYYEVNMSLGSIDFISKRVAYVYLCEFLEDTHGTRGLSGEFEGNVEIVLGEVDDLKNYHVDDDAIARIKQYIEVSKLK